MRTVVPSADFNVEFVQGGMKAAMKDAGAKSRDLLMVPVDNIKIVAGLNPRIHDAAYESHIEEIKESILTDGFYQHHPLGGYAGKEGTGEESITFIYLTSGFTRYEAARRANAEGAGIEELPVVLRPNGTNMVDITVGFDSDNRAERLRPYEKAIVAKRLIGYGQDEEQVAAKLKVSEQYVKDLLYMLSMPQGVQDMVISGATTLHTAVTVGRKHGKEALAVLKGAAGAGEAGTGEGEAETPATPARVTQGRVAASQRGASDIIPKGHYIAAIGYAIDLPGDGLDFLRRWLKGEKDAVKELATTLTKEGKAATRKAKREKEKAAKADEKAKKEAAAAKKKADAAAKKTARAVQAAIAAGDKPIDDDDI